MTSSARAGEFDPPFLVSAAAHETGLPRDGWVKCDQPMTLPVPLLGPRVGRLSPEALERVDAALRFALEL
jgi:mRNA-degrading endonuclease toxin of MazEF toxin-antitoxin module